MPNYEITNESESKQPTGSSKRKRKQSIKRNLGSEGNSEIDVKPAKVERTYGKRSRGERGKLSKEADEPEGKKIENNSPKRLCSAHEKTLNTQDEDSVRIDGMKDVSENKDKVKDTENTQCQSKQQCQNCKFCSEHKMGKSEAETPKEKSSRTKKKFPCEICAKEGSPKVYNSIEKHKNHMATVHEIYSDEMKRFECTDCPEPVWFPTKSKFTYHLGTKHPGIIKFICEICTETFKLKANYKTHMKTHNIVVQKKFSCDVCNGTFVNKAGFEAHKKRFPGPHIKQSCSHCGFSFSREKHMRNHRCKTLLLEEAAARVNNPNQEQVHQQEDSDNLKETQNIETGTQVDSNQVYVEKRNMVEMSTETDSAQKKLIEGDPQANKRVVLHRIIPRRTQDQTVYRPVQMQAQNIPESVVVQELREIDFEGGTFIAAAAAEPDQFIVRDINGHLVQGNQILQLDINEGQPGEESQVYFADWNIVTPYVIREKSP